MMKIAAIYIATLFSATAAGLFGDALSAAADAPRAASAMLVDAVADRANPQDAAMRPAPQRFWVRICLGPARIAIGGEPAVRVAFGGRGCGRSGSRLFGVELAGGASGRGALSI